MGTAQVKTLKRKAGYDTKIPAKQASVGAEVGQGIRGVDVEMENLNVATPGNKKAKVD